MPVFMICPYPWCAYVHDMPMSLIYSWYVHVLDILMVCLCSWGVHVHDVHMLVICPCPWYVHDMFMICSWNVHDMSMFNAGRWHICRTDIITVYNSCIFVVFYWLVCDILLGFSFLYIFCTKLCLLLYLGMQVIFDV